MVTLLQLLLVVAGLLLSIALHRVLQQLRETTRAFECVTYKGHMVERRLRECQLSSYYYAVPVTRNIFQIDENRSPQLCRARLGKLNALSSYLAPPSNGSLHQEEVTMRVGVPSSSETGVH
jgi:hypothetical protein